VPAHIISFNDYLSVPDQLAAAVKRIEAREEIVSVVAAGASWVIVTRKKPGRPAKETR